MTILFGVIIFISLYLVFAFGYHIGKNSYKYENEESEKDKWNKKRYRVKDYAKKSTDGINEKQASDVLKALFSKTVVEMTDYDAKGDKHSSDICIVVAGALKKAIDILDNLEEVDNE